MRRVLDSPEACRDRDPKNADGARAKAREQNRVLQDSAQSFGQRARLRDVIELTRS